MNDFGPLKDAFNAARKIQADLLLLLDHNETLRTTLNLSQRSRLVRPPEHGFPCSSRSPTVAEKRDWYAQTAEDLSKERARSWRDTSGQPLSAYQTSRRRFLPLIINGRLRHELPDSGVIGNAISEDYALSIGAVIKRVPNQNGFTNAKNRRFGTIGTTQLVISIPGTDSQKSAGRKWSCSFAVVEQLAAPLVIGTHFLRMTEAFTKLANLLVKKFISVLHDHFNGLKKVWRFMHMDPLTQEMVCCLDDKAIFAGLDSGSDIDVVSLDYARSRKWKTIPLTDGEGYVVLANNELVKLTGYVGTAFEIPGGYPESRRFYVLDGLACDDLLGDPTIEALDIFNQFQDFIIDRVSAKNRDCFHVIQWVETIDEIGQEVEKILAGSSDPPSVVPRHQIRGQEQLS